MISKTLYIAFLTTLLIGCHKNSSNNSLSVDCNFVDFYYYNNAKEPLGELSGNYILVAFDTTTSIAEIRNKIATIKDIDQSYKYNLDVNKIVLLKFSKARSCEEIASFIVYLQKDPGIIYASYTSKADCGNIPIQPTFAKLCLHSYTNYFHVKVIDANNLTDLHKMVTATNTEIEGQNQFMPNWFRLKVNKQSKGHALQMANYFLESGLFQVAEPDILTIPAE